MPAYYRASVQRFLDTSESELTGVLTTAYAASGFTAQKTAQTLAWIRDVFSLRTTLAEVIRARSSAATWSVLLEFPIPRKEKRIDLVLLAAQTIVLFEFKSSSPDDDATRQVEEYALLLHYFHQPSCARRILPFVVSPVPSAKRVRRQMFLPIVEAPQYWIAPVRRLTWQNLASELATAIPADDASQIIDATAWDDGEYRPVPTIIDAARALQSGLTIREIAHSRADRYDVEKLTNFVGSCIDQARASSACVICFVTGVPGSGKTLVGLNLAFRSSSDQDPIHFMSGTGPLVKVLQAAMAAHHCKSFNVPAAEGRRKAATLIENVHVFARYYAEENRNRPPSNHIIIFDEAQRAWDQKQNLSKFKRPYSEPEMLLSIMERHDDWAVVIALVGGGQEINNGEAGLEEWGRALAAAQKPWTIFASPEALAGGAAVAGSQLFSAVPHHQLRVMPERQLHLDVSVRSLRADSYSAWVNQVLLGNAASARELAEESPFAVLLTRSLADLRSLLRQHTIGESRCGLVASSAAARIRAEGLEPDSSFHAEYPWHHWFLAESSDVRSSYQLEVFATEFEIQGLELDWIGLVWGGDFIWSSVDSAWLCRAFAHKRQSSWSTIKQERRRTYRRNAYRVLLTRARQGIVIYIPVGDPQDPTRNPTEFNQTAAFLLACGAREAQLEPLSELEEPQPGPLF